MKDTIPLQTRLVLEALQLIKTSNKNNPQEVSARQAVIMLESMLLTFIKDMYGDDTSFPYEQLSAMEIKKTGVLEQYMAEFKACFRTAPPEKKDIVFIHQSVSIQTKPYTLIYDSLTSLANDPRGVVIAERKKGKGNPYTYRITSAGSMVVEQIRDGTIPTRYPKKLRNKHPLIPPISTPVPYNVSADTMRLIASADDGLAGGKLFEALSLYRQANERSKKETGAFIPELYYNMGVCLSSLGNISEAIESYRSALFLNEKFMDASFALGVLFTTRGQHKDALEYLKKAHEIAPQNTQVLAQLLLVLLSLNKNEEAAGLLLRNKNLILTESKKVLSTPILVGRASGTPVVTPQYTPSGRGTDISRVPNRLRMNHTEDSRKKSIFKCVFHGHEKSSRRSDMVCGIPALRGTYCPAAVLQKKPELQGQKDSVESIAEVSYNIGVSLIENGEYEQARKFLTLTQSIMPADSLTKYILKDIEHGKTNT